MLEGRKRQIEKSLPERLADAVIDIILSDGLQQGDRLPNEADLAGRLGAGRSSVREAMKLLASRNIVTVRQGSGTYVASTPGLVDDPLGFTFVRDKRALARDLLEVRILIEPTVASMAAQRATGDDVERISACVDEVERLCETGEDHAEADMAFHRAIALSSGNMVVPRLIPIIASAIPVFIDVTGNVLVAETVETHRAVAEAIASHDAVAAHDAMYLHLIYNRRQLARDNG